MLRGVRRLSGTAAKPFAEDLARKIAHELRASPAALASIEQLGVEQLGPARLAKYVLARALVQSQGTGCSLYPPRPEALTPNGMSPADELLIRAVAALEEQAASRGASASAGPATAAGPDVAAVATSPMLTAANKASRTFLMSFLEDAIRAGGGTFDAPQLLARWRSESVHKLSESAADLTKLQGVRAHLLSRLELDRQQRELDLRKRLQQAREMEAAGSD
ncbi:hypothetical protein KFE25_001773 [Diacronema lutheri]|uniref:Uncharacterized protein n=1 Tax=Diacronema lutheri TaxID=2081491 RepID=A0A8J5XPD4_DIALT|nr:hypothetical protein KFE25_001773 [Diacronema lutheri]